MDGKEGVGVGRAWDMDGVGQNNIPYMITRDIDGEEIETAALQLWEHLEAQSVWPTSLYGPPRSDDALTHPIWPHPHPPHGTPRL